jgi:hypothetical protein
MRASGVPFSPHHAENVPGEGRPIVDRADGVYPHRELRVLKLASMPAVLLEAGVIVNRQEELEIASANRCLNTARAVASAFAEFCTSVNAVVGGPNRGGASLPGFPFDLYCPAPGYDLSAHAGAAIRAWAGQHARRLRRGAKALMSSPGGGRAPMDEVDRFASEVEGQPGASTYPRGRPRRASGSGAFR